MAYLVSNEFKNKIYDEDSEQILVIKINNNIINNDYIRECTLKDEVFNNDTFSLGSAVVSEIVLSLDNEIVNEIGSFSEIELNFKIILDNNEEIVPLGNYIVVKTDNNSELYTKYTLHDYMEKLNKPCDLSSYMPCTRLELYNHVCNDFGIEAGVTNFINGSVLINVFDSSYTAKDYLSYISERAGGFCKVIRNKLYIKSFGEVDTINLPIENMGDFTIDEKRKISKIVYYNAIQRFENGDDTGVTVYLNQDNPLSCTQEEVDNIYNSLVNLEYQSLDVRIWGDPFIDTGDIIKIGEYQSFVQKNWTFGNGFYGKYKTILKNTTNPESTSKTSSKIRKLQSKINELEGTIEITAQETISNKNNIEEINSNINNNIYNKTQTEQLIINSSAGLTNTFSEAGGNNVLRNTNFSAKEVLEEGQNYEYWYGDIERQVNNEAVNGYSIKLKTSNSDTKLITKNGNNEITIQGNHELSAIEYNIDGKCEQESEPSPTNPSEIKTIKGITNLFDKDNTNTINGFVNGNTGLFSAKTNHQKSFYIEIEPNTTYTISGFERTTNAGTFTELPVENESIATKKIGGVTSWTFTSGENDKYLVCMYDAGNAGYTYNNVQLEKSPISHSYVPYGTWLKSKISNDNQEQNALFNLNNNELCSIGNIKDTLEVVSGKLIKKIGKYEIDTSNITLHDTYENITYAVIPILNNDISYDNYDLCPIICTHAIYKSLSNWDNSEMINCISNQASKANYWIGFAKGTTLNEIKEKMDGCVIYYKLVEQQQIQLTLTNIPLFEDINHIILEEDIETNTNIKYNEIITIGHLTQEQVVANGPYTLSFYYRIVNPLANVKVKVNDTEYLLEDTNWTLFQTGIKDDDGKYLTEPINITDNKLKVEFITDINNACEIYDIMLNYGSVKLAYSQNQNETVTDTVNIGKGITITSSTSDVKFVANNDGIRTKTINNEVITKFTDKGLDTNEAVITNEATIVGILRQKVGNQVWDCMI